MAGAKAAAVEPSQRELTKRSLPSGRLGYGWGMGASGLLTMHTCTHAHMRRNTCRLFCGVAALRVLVQTFGPRGTGEGVDSGVCTLVCRAGG